MRTFLPAVTVLAVSLLAGCGTDSSSAAPAEPTSSAIAAWVGPSGLEVESEQAARAALEAQRLEAERLAVEAAAQAAAAEAAAQRAAAEATAQRAAEEAAAQAVIEAEGGCPPGWYFDDYLGCADPESGVDGDPYVGEEGHAHSDLEVRCSDGTATVDECFGPGSDLDGNGIADINE